MQTFWLSDVIDPNIPTAMLPADVQQFMFGEKKNTPPFFPFFFFPPPGGQLVSARR